MTNRIPTLFGALLMLLFLAGPAWGADEGKAGDPSAEEVFEQACEYLAGLGGFSVDVSLTLNVHSGDKETKVTFHNALAMKRPKLLSSTITRDDNARPELKMVCDGEDLYIYVPRTNEYMVRPAPSNISSVLAELGQGPTRAAMAWVGELLRDAPFREWRERTETAQYVGLEAAADVKRHHLKIAVPNSGLDVWVNDGDAPLITRSLLDLSGLVSQDQAGEGKGEMIVTFELANWDVNPDLPPETFRFEPPEGAKQFSGEEEHPLSGKPAPAFTVDLLDGGKLDLATHKGKNVVVLDFWATWCGPCRIAMPVLVEVTNQYKDKGVAFYAVNVGEAPAAVRAFLKKSELSLAVALDSDGKVSELYKVQGIPQTVIIGKDGIVKQVHVGVAPNLEEQLKEDLEAALKP